MNIAFLLENSAKRHPEKVALVFEDKKFTYEQLNDLASRFAKGLKKLGLKKGDIVVLMMQNSPEFIVAYYAIAHLGCVVIPVNFLFKVHELSHIINDASFGSCGYYYDYDTYFCPSNQKTWL